MDDVAIVVYLYINVISVTFLLIVSTATCFLWRLQRRSAKRQWARGSGEAARPRASLSSSKHA